MLSKDLECLPVSLVTHKWLCVFCGPFFPVFVLNTGKYGPEKTLYLDTFHVVVWGFALLGLFGVASGPFLVALTRSSLFWLVTAWSSLFRFFRNNDLRECLSCKFFKNELPFRFFLQNKASKVGQLWCITK